MRNMGNAAIYFRGHERRKRDMGKRNTRDTRHKGTQETQGNTGHREHREAQGDTRNTVENGT